MEEYSNFDQLSFDLGMVEAFCELVGKYVKKIGLSPILNPECFTAFEPLSQKIAEKYGVKSFVEWDFIPSDLASPAEIANKIVIFYYMEDEDLAEYKALKQEAVAHRASGTLDKACLQGITIRLMELLSYPPRAILEAYPA